MMPRKIRQRGTPRDRNTVAGPATELTTKDSRPKQADKAHLTQRVYRE